MNRKRSDAENYFFADKYIAHFTILLQKYFPNIRYLSINFNLHVNFSTRECIVIKNFDIDLIHTDEAAVRSGEIYVEGDAGDKNAHLLKG